MRRLFVGTSFLAFALLAACGDGAVPEPAADAPAIEAAEDAAGVTAELSPVCRNLERIVTARGDTPAFSSLPDGFALKDGVSCSAAEHVVKLGAGQTPTTLSGYTCMLLNEPGALEAAAWPVWESVLADAPECASNGWIMLTDTDISGERPKRSILFFREADAPRLVLPEGTTEPVRFEWSQEGGQTILLFVAAP